MGTESKTIEYEYNQTRISLRSSTEIYIIYKQAGHVTMADHGVQISII